MKIKTSGFIFCALMLLMAFIYQYHQILFLRPVSVHQWRQCDCLSMTLNYFKENRSFFDPSVCWIGENGTGQTISEFPLIYYAVAQLWKIFGQHEFIFRALVVLLMFTSLFLLFKTFERFLDNSFLAIGLVMLLFTSPIWVYYGNNFIADVPGLSFAIIGWFYFMKFYREEKNKFFLIAMFFFLVGGLIKISSLISVTSIAGVFLLETFFNFKLGEGRKIFDKPNQQFIPFVIIAIAISLWLKYVLAYNGKHNVGILLTGFLPIWNFSGDRILYVWNQFIHYLIFTYYFKWTLFVLLFFFITSILFYKKANRFLLTINIFMAAGVITYLILWFDVLHNHDYYLINLLIFAVVTCLNFFMLIIFLMH